MWWMVGCLWPQRGQLGSVLSLHRLRFSGVGRVSVPALKRKDIWPAGRPCMILFQTWLEFSNSATSRILLWTVSSFSLLWCFSITCLNSPLQWLLRVLLKMVVIDDLTLSSRSTLDGWILWFLQYSSSVRIDRISSMTGSCDVEVDVRKVNFALDLRSDNDGISITFGWWRAEVVKHLGRFSHCLIILRVAACIFLMAVSGIGSIAMTKWKEGTRYKFTYLLALISRPILAPSLFITPWLAINCPENLILKGIRILDSLLKSLRLCLRFLTHLCSLLSWFHYVHRHLEHLAGTQYFKFKTTLSHDIGTACMLKQSVIQCYPFLDRFLIFWCE